MKILTKATMAKKAIELDASNANKIRVGSLITGRATTNVLTTGKVTEVGKMETFGFIIYHFTIESGELLKVYKTTF